MLRLDKELTAAGCPTDEETFRGVVREMFSEVFGSWTDEDLLCRPKEALRFCNLIRATIGCDTIEDYVILRTLTNLRKRCALEAA